MLTRLVKNQLRLYVVISVVVLVVLAVSYVQIPAQLGMGRYRVDVQLPQAAGLYARANVTYRGYQVGRVKDVTLRPGGSVVAQLQIDDGTKIPADAVAEVRSTSVIGEQYIDFVPPPGATSTANLADGAVVPASQTTLPTTTDALLSSVDDFLTSVPRHDLTTVVDQLGTAFEGTGGDLDTILDAGSALSDEATKNLRPTTDLINELKPVLGTQQRLDPSIRTYARSLDALTKQLHDSDGDLRAVIAEGSPAVKSVADFVSTVGPQLRGTLQDLEQVGAVLGAYVPGLEDILIVLPAAVQMFGSGTIQTMGDKYVEGNLYFKMSFPTPCTTGFPERDKIRSPYDLTAAPLPRDSYCKVAPTSPLVVRGARNAPCPNDPARRSATAAGCGLVFDVTGVQQSAVARGDSLSAMVAPQMARLIAPSGSFFLLDPEAKAGPTTWRQLMTQLVAP